MRLYRHLHLTHVCSLLVDMYPAIPVCCTADAYWLTCVLLTRPPHCYIMTLVPMSVGVSLLCITSPSQPPLLDRYGAFIVPREFDFDL